MEQVKLTRKERRDVIARCEAELAREAKRAKLDASLERLLTRAGKDGFHISKKLFAHTIQKDSERFEFVDYQPMRY